MWKNYHMSNYRLITFSVGGRLFIDVIRETLLEFFANIYYMCEHNNERLIWLWISGNEINAKSYNKHTLNGELCDNHDEFAFSAFFAWSRRRQGKSLVSTCFNVAQYFALAGAMTWEQEGFWCVILWKVLFSTRLTLRQYIT